MHNMFSINGTGILTLKDLQREFSPWDIYANLADFVQFASIHSQPLPTKMLCDGEWTDTKYFNKAFWITLINVHDWPKSSNAVQVMNMFVEEIVLVDSGVKDSFAQDKNIGIDIKNEKDKSLDYSTAKDNIIKEYKALCIEKKLQHIVKTAKLSDSAQNSRTAVILLAICELSEVNALEYSFSKVEAEEASQDDSSVSEFPRTNDVLLLTRNNPYKYWYHSSEKLKSGEEIKTVCVRAKAGDNRHAVVTVQLYDDVSKQCVHTLKLSADEYRYCNVAGDKIIKFLPTISMSPDAYLSRNDLTKATISVCAEGADEWTLDEDNVASFGIASNNEGFVFVKNYNLNAVFYKKANDFFVKMMLSLIVDPVVETQLTEEGYKILTSKGEVFSNIPSYEPEKDVVSLDNYSRYPLAQTELAKTNEATEISLGPAKDCIMIRLDNKKKNVVLFKSCGKHIYIHRDTQHGLNLTVK